MAAVFGTLILIAAPSAIADVIGTAQSLLNNIDDPSAMATIMQTESGFANCDQTSTTTYNPSDFVDSPFGESYEFRAPFTYYDCSWVVDPLYMEYEITGVQRYYGVGNYSCSKTFDSYSQSDTFWDDSVSWYLTTNCYMDCDDEYDVNTRAYISARYSSISASQANLYEGC